MTLITDPLFYLCAIPGVILLGMSKGGFAGIGMASTPLLALVMPPLQAAAIMLPILLLQDALSMWVYRKNWDGWNLLVMLPGAVAGVGGAWLLAAHVSDAAVRLLVGLISLSFVLYAWLTRGRPAPAARPHVAAGTFWGSLAGFTSTLIQIGAPPYYAFVLPQRLEKMVFVATTCWFFAIVNWIKVVPYFALGQFSQSGLATSAVLLPLAVASNFLGIWLVRITPARLFFGIANTTVFVLGAELTRQGAMALWM